MDEIQKQIEEFIEKSDQMKPGIKIIFAEITVWLEHQQSIISQQNGKIALLEGDVNFFRNETNAGLKVISQQSKRITDHEAKIMVLEQDNEMLEETVSQQSAEIERLRNALISERDAALLWDGIGTANRINKVLEGGDHAQTTKA